MGRNSRPQEDSPKPKTALGRWTQGTVVQSRVVANFPPRGPPNLRVTQPEECRQCASPTMRWGDIRVQRVTVLWELAQFIVWELAFCSVLIKEHSKPP